MPTIERSLRLLPLAVGLIACQKPAAAPVAPTPRFAAVDGARLASAAKDAATGKQVWSVVTVDTSKRYTITGAPRIVKGKVLIGNGGAEFGVRGYISAYDAESGNLAWRFYTVPGDPSKPFESPVLKQA